MKLRKLSSRFIDSQIAKMDAFYDKALFEMQPLPAPDEFGQVKMSYLNLRKLLKNRSHLDRVNGFWAGWSLAKGDQP